MRNASAMSADGGTGELNAVSRGGTDRIYCVGRSQCEKTPFAICPVDNEYFIISPMVCVY